MRERPSALTIWGVLYLILGGVFLGIVPLFGLLYIGVGIGLLMMRLFARHLAIGASAAFLIFNTLVLPTQLSKSWRDGQGLSMVLTMLLFYLFNGFVLYYFTRPRVKIQFQ